MISLSYLDGHGTKKVSLRLRFGIGSSFKICLVVRNIAGPKRFPLDLNPKSVIKFGENFKSFRSSGT